MSVSNTRRSGRPPALDIIVGWLEQRGGAMYGGEAVTQLEHAMQCADRARSGGASPDLITAALLHDLGHLADTGDDRKQPHGEFAATLLQDMFPPAVTEPVRLHVDAKRYLCAVDPTYRDGLSPASQQSLEWQGGPFSREMAAAFIGLPFAADAVRLRRWDDEAKIPGVATPPLADFIAIMKHVYRPAGEAA
jgi:phosphonate degradation associated HDIG domain protein